MANASEIMDEVPQDVQDMIEIQFNIKTGTSTTRRCGRSGTIGTTRSGRLQNEKEAKAAADLVLTYPKETDGCLHPSGIKVEHRFGRKVKRTAKRTRTLCEFPLCVSVAQTGRYGRMCKKHSREVAGLSNDNADQPPPSHQSIPLIIDSEKCREFAKSIECGAGTKDSRAALRSPTKSHPPFNSSSSPDRNMRKKSGSGCVAPNISLPDNSTNLIHLYDTMVVPEGWSKGQRILGCETVISFAKERGPTLSPHDIGGPRPMELFLFNNSRHVLYVNGKAVVPSQIGVTLPSLSRPLKWDNVAEVLSSLHLFYAPCPGKSGNCALIVRKPCTICMSCRKQNLDQRSRMRTTEWNA